MKMTKIVIATFVLSCLLFQSEAFTQTPTNKVDWSSFNLGFGVLRSANTQVCSAIGQSFVGATQNANTLLVSGFLVHASISGLKTAVEDKTQEETQLPTSYELLQNYPNPFNPSTTIAFALPKASDVTLKLFDMFGRELATLAEGKFSAGRHQVVFDATSFSSGVYFYRLQADEFSQTRRLTLVK